MKQQINRIKIRIFATLFACLGVVSSCQDSFLDRPNPNVLDPSVFPTRFEDLDLMLIDLYGRLRTGYYNSDSYRRVGLLLDNSADQGYNGSEFNEFGTKTLLPSTGTVGYLWTTSYEAIARCNSFLAAVAQFQSGGTTISDDQKRQLRWMEGQARFIRAIHYFFLVNCYGESMITSAADRNKMGVPLRTEVASQISDSNLKRATVGENWDLIVSDLEKANALLQGKTWDDANKARVDTWAAKSFLGKAYVFTQQWQKARDTLRVVVETSGKKLVPYNILRNMFNGRNKFNSESIFEINFTPDTRDVWNQQINTSTQHGVFISPTFVDANGVEQTNGFGNLFIHDQNILRYGFADTTAVNQRRPDYIAFSRQVRRDKSVDPRLYVTTLQPFVDSLVIDGVSRVVGKNRAEGFDLRRKKAWCHRKYVVVDRNVWAGDGPALATNMYFMRLPDVYLLYAEAHLNGGNQTTALEYINKVHRRAYDVPVDAPSQFDYASLTARTKAAASDHLANNPLRYERWAEFVCEGQWWFDVCRWRIGAQESSYYQAVMSGPINWNDNKYAMPLPEAERLNNTLAVQNPGY